jgi:putative transcriptional regulator
MIPASQLVADDIALTVAPEMLASVVRGTGPRRSVFVLGYAGWGPGQLEGEIRRGGWATVSSDAELLFGVDQDRKWERALARRKLQI